MRWFTRTAALVLGLLTILGSVVWVQIVDRYLDASEFRVEFPWNVGYKDVLLPPITSDDQIVTVGVLFQLANPSDIAIEVVSISYRFYMDNLTDTRPFVDKDESIFVAVGGYFAAERGQIVAAHSIVFLWANMTVNGLSQPQAFDRLNRTFNGRYYPIIDAGLVYRIPETKIVDRVLGIVFTTDRGVVPRAT